MYWTKSDLTLYNLKKLVEVLLRNIDEIFGVNLLRVLRIMS